MDFNDITEDIVDTKSTSEDDKDIVFFEDNVRPRVVSTEGDRRWVTLVVVTWLNLEDCLEDDKAVELLKLVPKTVSNTVLVVVKIVLVRICDGNAVVVDN